MTTELQRATCTTGYAGVRYGEDSDPGVAEQTPVAMTVGRMSPSCKGGHPTAESFVAGDGAIQQLPPLPVFVILAGVLCSTPPIQDRSLPCTVCLQ